MLQNILSSLKESFLSISKKDWLLIAISVAITIAFLIGLQFWRPYFFLTDDNMSEFLPFFINTGCNLLHFKNPAVAQYIFGGDYPLAKDPGFVQQLNPFYWPVALLANTPWKYAIMDCIVGLNLIICAAGTAGVCLLIRKRFSAPTSDAQIIFLAVAYAATPFAFIVGSSWMQHVAYMAVFPLFALGMLCESFVVGILFICIGFIHGFLGGNVGPFLYILTFFSSFAIFQCIADHSYRPLYRWIIGIALVALLISPIWIQTISGFLQTGRFYPMPSWKMWAGRFPHIVLPLGALLGPPFGFLFSKELCIFNLNPLHTCSIPFFPLSWLVLFILIQKRRFSWQESTFLMGAAVVALFVMRPFWLNNILHQLPAFASIRMPFREVGGTYFFLIGWLAFQKIDFKSWSTRLALLIGGFFYFLIFFHQPPPAINEMTMDRRLLTSGAADHYWEEVKKKLPPNAVILPTMDGWFPHPFTLIGGANYPLIFKVTSANGKSSARFWKESEKGLPGGWHWSGMYNLGAALEYQKQRPNAVILQLTSLNPIEIWLIDSHHREKLDLKTLLPPDIYNQL